LSEIAGRGCGGCLAGLWTYI